MLCYEIYLNGSRLYRAGGCDRAFGAHVSWLSHPAYGITLGVTGLNEGSDQGVHWGSEKLGFGDEVTIKVLDSETADPPNEPIRTTRNFDLRMARSEHQRLKERLAAIEALWGNELWLDDTTT